MGIAAELREPFAELNEELAGIDGLEPIAIRFIRYTVDTRPGYPPNPQIEFIAEYRGTDLKRNDARSRRQREGTRDPGTWQLSIVQRDGDPVLDETMYAYIDVTDSGEEISGRVSLLNPTDAPDLVVSVDALDVAPVPFEQIFPRSFFAEFTATAGFQGTPSTDRRNPEAMFSAVGSMEASLTVPARLTAEFASEASFSGDMGQPVELPAEFEAIGSMEATLTVPARLTAEFGAIADFEATPSSDAVFDAEFESVGEFEAALTVPARLTAEFTATADFEARLPSDEFEAEFEAEASFEAQLTVPAQASGEFDAEAGFEAALTVPAQVAGEFDSEGSFEAALTVPAQPASDFESIGSFEATLTVPARLTAEFGAIADFEAPATAPAQLSADFDAEGSFEADMAVATAEWLDNDDNPWLDNDDNAWEY